MPKYEVKNIKTFRGREGTGFNGTLYRDGKRVATVDDPASGGCYDWHWLDYKEARVNVAIVNYRGDSFDRPCTPEEKILVEHVAEVLPDVKFEAEDSFVGNLVHEWEVDKQYRSWCKKKTCFLLKGDNPEEGWRSIPQPYSTKVLVALAKKYGDQLGEILNDRYPYVTTK